MNTGKKHSNTVHMKVPPTRPLGPTVPPQSLAGNGQEGVGGVLPTLEKKAGGGVFDLAGWIEDERVSCSSCQHLVQVMNTINMPADQFDKVRRQNHPSNQWMFDIVKIKNGWAKVEYIGLKCDGGENSYIPVDVMHRCNCYKPKATAQAFNVKEWWE